MISSRLQRRLLSVRCAHLPARSAAAAAHTTQRRLASSSSSPSSSPPPRQPPPQQPPTPTARRQAAAPPRSAGSGTATTTAAATLSRMQAERDASRWPAETADEYKTRYKSAARRFTLTVIALPILLVTSYYLFDRLALGHERKVLNRKETKRDG
ncbi:hypothetical protein CRV24_002474 [Beauveria bassiana]|nr:hypothetical protein CRV24_002474 [Beauveria bassiana]KAH8717841.1 hypothetical protein HC256_002516 [Beauveria bassiana]